MSRLSVAPPTKINQQHWLIFCFCFSVLDHYGHHVIVKVWRLNSGLWNFMKWKEKSWVAGGPGAEDQSRLLSCLARLNTGLDLEFLTGIAQCVLTTLQKLWDPSIESVGHYNQNNHFGENFSNSMIDDWFGFHSYTIQPIQWRHCRYLLSLLSSLLTVKIPRLGQVIHLDGRVLHN